MAPNGAGSVTHWIGALRDGDEEAARQLWRRYYEALVRLARARLRVRAVVDEEDVALSAFDSFYAGVARGRFPDITDRDDLWRLLVTMTARKACNQARREARQKRGGGRVALEADVVGAEGDLLGRVAGSEPTPEFAAMVADEYRHRLEALPEDTLRRVAALKMEGYHNEEIAALTGLGLRSVVRKLDLIRRTWTDLEAP
jgi:DNA-directed RNA polymerase specialized sigma24 family protein